MNKNKVINVLNAAKANNGLSREEIERICGKETDVIVGYLHLKDVCIWATNGSIIMLKRESSALLIDELRQKKKSKFSGVIKWVMENIIAPLIKS
jgi:hypothetical protein